MIDRSMPLRLALFVLLAVVLLNGQSQVHTVVNQVSTTVPVLQETLIEIRKMAQRYEQMGTTIEKTCQEQGELARSLREAVPDLRRAHDEIQNSAHQEDEVAERQDAAAQADKEKEKDNVTKTLDNLNDSLKRLSQALSDENLRNLSESFKNLRTSSENLQSVTKNADTFYKNGAEAMRKANDMYEQAEKVFSNLVVVTKPLADRSESIFKNLDESTEKLSQVLSSLDELLRAFTQADGTFRRLLTDPVLYNNLNTLTCFAIQMMPHMDRILRDMQVFADKIARHPELLGVSGVVRPSIGIKEVPVTTPVWPPPPGH